MGDMTHIMVDTETTDTTPDIAGILQLAAIKFNPDTMEIGPAFNGYPSLLPRRRWSESTRKFWRVDNAAAYAEMIAQQRAARDVFQAFANFCAVDAPFGGAIFVAKPLKFDWPIVESNMLDLDIVFPFAHGRYLDMHSWISGLRGTGQKTTIEDEVPFPVGGTKHNALHDCAWQIDCMFEAKRRHVHAEIA